MPIYATTFFLPASAGVPFLMEDIYFRGGYRTVTDEAARDAINMASRKPGMKVYVQSTGKTYTVQTGALGTWVEVEEGGAKRASFQYTPGSPVPNGQNADFILTAGKTLIVLQLTVSHPGLTVEAHSTPTRADTSPYTFISYTGHLSDDGSSKMDDESLEFNRRYAIVSNLEAEPGDTTYWRVTNNSGGSITPVVDIVYIPIEA